MRKLVVIFLLLLNFNLFANPIIIDAPVISEYFYNQGNWQIELCIKSDLYGWLKIQSFDQLFVVTDAGQVLFQTFTQFSYDSVYVIDQSWLSSTLIINPVHDNINVIYNDYPYWTGISYAPAADTMCVTTPGENESVAVQYFGFGYSHYLMKQSPPSIGTDVFEVTSRSGISGYVYDQYQNPVPGLSLDYYPSLEGKFPLPLISIETDSNGYYESDEIYPMGYYVELTMNNYVLKTDMMYFEPDSSYYKEYTLTNASIPTIDPFFGIEMSATPNPFQNKTTFSLDIPEEMVWNDAKIIIRNLNGQTVDFIPLTANPWAGGEISVDWTPGSLPKGLCIYSLMMDGQAVRSGKLIMY